jgi:hypothetical protein
MAQETQHLQRTLSAQWALLSSGIIPTRFTALGNGKSYQLDRHFQNSYISQANHHHLLAQAAKKTPTNSEKHYAESRRLSPFWPGAG